MELHFERSAPGAYAAGMFYSVLVRSKYKNKLISHDVFRSYRNVKEGGGSIMY